MNLRKWIFVVAIFLSFETFASNTPKALNSSVSAPTVEGPITGGLRGIPWATTIERLAPLEENGFVQEEFFYSGSAQGIDHNGEFTGKNADYKTRMLVTRPKDPKKFNGTVFMEWMNVTAEMELPVLWALSHEELLREGYAYVSVSVQHVGVSASPLAIKVWDPIRYESLKHPGDNYADSIFEQAAKAMVDRKGPSPLGNLLAKRIIAGGESQSAGLLITYVNKVHPINQIFDGFLIHTWPGAINDDVNVPVTMILSEGETGGFTSPLGPLGDLLGLPEKLGEFVANLGILRMPKPIQAPADHKNFRVWEVAGGSHFDQQSLYYMLALVTRDLSAPLKYPLFFTLKNLCVEAPNTLAMDRPTKAALHQLNSWVTYGKAPKSFPRVSRNVDGTLERNFDDLSVGGIQMPRMAVPIGVNRADECLFFGTYEPFALQDTRSRYQTAEKYIDAVRSAAARNVAEGSLLKPEAQEYVNEAILETKTIWKK